MTGPGDLALRLATGAALGVDAVVHLRLAPGYQAAAPEGVGAGNLFRAEAVAAVLAAGYVVLRGTGRAYVVALAVAGSALAAVLLYRYVDIPALGPLPAMYEPVWFGQKLLTAVAEAVAVVLCVGGIVRAAGRRPVSG